MKAPTRGPLRDVRRSVMALVIVTFSLAAAMGIAALLWPGSFGDTEGKVLLTTLLTGVESIAVLCYLTLVGSRAWPLGAVGGVVSAAASATGLLLIWSDWTDTHEDLGQLFGLDCTWAGSVAQACLLVALSKRRTIIWVLTGTLVAVTAIGLMISTAIYDGGDLDSAFWRTFGVIAILDVLGTVVLAAIGAFGRPRAVTRGSTIDSAVWAKAQQLAQAQGISPSQLVSDALDAYTR